MLFNQLMRLDIHASAYQRPQPSLLLHFFILSLNRSSRDISSRTQGGEGAHEGVGGGVSEGCSSNVMPQLTSVKPSASYEDTTKSETIAVGAGQPGQGRR